MKKIGVALLGLGVVGGGTYEILTTKRDYIRANDGIDVEVKAVLERNEVRIKELSIDPTIVAKDIEEIVSNPDIHVVAEFFGGVEPARTFLLKALENGKSIVTANKEMFSKSWPDLEKAAKKGGAGLYFEASCVGGVPIIRTSEEKWQIFLPTMTTKPPFSKGRFGGNVTQWRSLLRVIIDEVALSSIKCLVRE